MRALKTRWSFPAVSRHSTIRFLLPARERLFQPPAIATKNGGLLA
jgi:hypothetical protein